MEIRKIEDLVYCSDKELRKLPSYWKSENIFYGLSNFSSGLKKASSGKLISNPEVLKDLQTEYFNGKLYEHDPNMLRAEMMRIVRDPLGWLDDFVQTSKSDANRMINLLKEMSDLSLSYIDNSRAKSPGSILNKRRLFTDFGDGQFRQTSDLRYSRLQGDEKLQYASRVMQEGLESLKKAESEFPVLHYGGNSDLQEVSVLESQIDAYLNRKVNGPIQKLDAAKEMFRDIFNTKTEDLNVRAAAQKNFYKTKIRADFQNAVLSEADQALDFLRLSSENIYQLRESGGDVSTEKILSYKLSRLVGLMEHSEFLQESEERFHETIATCEEAASEAYFTIIPESCRIRAEEKISIIGEKSFHLDGAIAREGDDWADLAMRAVYQV